MTFYAVCVCKKRGEMCRKTSKRQPLWLAKKKENRERGCHFRKKREYFAHKYTRKRREELRDFEDDERAREQRLRGNKRAE